MIQVIVNLRCDSSGRAEHHLRTMTDLSCQSNRLGARRAIDSARGRDNSETHRPSHVDSVIIGPGTSTRGRAWHCSVCSSPGSGMLFPSCTCRPCNLSISFIHSNTVFFILSIFFTICSFSYLEWPQVLRRRKRASAAPLRWNVFVPCTLSVDMERIQTEKHVSIVVAHRQHTSTRFQLALTRAFIRLHYGTVLF